MSKIIGTKSFSVGNYTIECEMLRTRSGTRENATFYKEGIELSTGTDFWSNRPWYPFTYANAIRDALNKSGEFTPEEVNIIIEKLGKDDHDPLKDMFKLVGTIAKMGEVFTDNQKDSNDWKLRMMKAGLPALDVPSDWDTLTEDEKTSRLNKVIELQTEVEE